TTLDVVVATSAFGLGIDQPDVRAVIHATTPETCSRFYQEVGRGGRDGRSASSLLLHVDADWQLATRLARRIYPNEKVKPRWDSMRSTRHLSRDRTHWWVDLDDLQPGLRGAGKFTSERNRGWNQRVLTLLQQARLISLETPIDEEPPVEMTSPVGVRPLQHDMESEAWSDRWRTVREGGRANAMGDLDAIRDIIEGERCIAEVVS